VVADNGAIALKLLGTVTFNLITLDINMPIMDGYQFLEKLPEYAPTTPVIVISGNLEEITSHSQIKANLAKPINSNRLLTLIAACLA
jgi:CheY-like chemotaxis protein